MKLARLSSSEEVNVLKRSSETTSPGEYNTLNFEALGMWTDGQDGEMVPVLSGRGSETEYWFLALGIFEDGFYNGLFWRKGSEQRGVLCET